MLTRQIASAPFCPLVRPRDLHYTRCDNIDTSRRSPLFYLQAPGAKAGASNANVACSPSVCHLSALATPAEVDVDGLQNSDVPYLTETKSVNSADSVFLGSIDAPPRSQRHRNPCNKPVPKVQESRRFSNVSRRF